MTEKIKDRLTGAFWGALVCFLISYMAGGYHFRDTAKMVVRTDTLHDTVTVREPVLSPKGLCGRTRYGFRL